MGRPEPTPAQLAARDRAAGTPYREDLLLVGFLWAAAGVLGLLLVPWSWNRLFPAGGIPLWLGLPPAAVVGFAFWNGYRGMREVVVFGFLALAGAAGWRGLVGAVSWSHAVPILLACLLLAAGLWRSAGLDAFHRLRATQRPVAIREVWIVIGVVALAVITVLVWVVIGMRTF